MRKHPVILLELIDAVCERLEKNERVRRVLPGSGRIHIDRQLPFLCVYRRPEDRNDRGTERLVMSEASYLIASPKEIPAVELRKLLRPVIRALVKEFGGFLLVEVWSGPAVPRREDGRPTSPAFRVVVESRRGIGGTVDTLRDHLERITIHKMEAEVTVERGRTPAPPGWQPLLTTRMARELGCHLVGIETAPLYRGPQGEILYPLVLRHLVRGMSRALKRMFHHFARTQTRHTPASYMALGRRAMVKAVWEVDGRLADINESFDFLLQATPSNAERAWKRFRRRRFEEAPSFSYRPLPIDPVLMKRKLFQVPIERVEDPTLEQIFREKQSELDRQLTMLQDIGTKKFFYGGLQLYGRPNERLVQTAREVLSALGGGNGEGSRGKRVKAHEFAELAREELCYYSRLFPEFRGKVEVRDDIYSGLLVSWGKLLIGRETRIPVWRADALLQHEVGTHMVTDSNGRAQPFRQLYTGLAGYDELQEGLAVLAEYLVGGFSRGRVRLLAARVLAAHGLVDGGTFVDVFRQLHREFGFDQNTAFTITMRIFRGGGLTKDAVYLRGLLRVLDHVKSGGDIEPLFVGKIASRHIALVKELQWREVLRPMPIRPRYLDDPESTARLRGLENGYDLLSMVQYPKREGRKR
jgi:uncharacterized protein (TIGR02421 family)